MQRNRSDFLVEVASKIKEALQSLLSLYGQLPALIDQEHDAISRHDFRAMSELGERKQKASTEIEAMVSEMLLAAERLRAHYTASLGGDLPAGDSTLSQAVAVLDALRGRLEPNDLGGQVVAHILKGIRQLFEQFQIAKSSTQGQMLLNQRVLQRMLQNYQESYRFWQELAVECQASYDASGAQKGSRVNFTLNIKA